jgi:hypothetical protein
MEERNPILVRPTGHHRRPKFAVDAVDEAGTARCRPRFVFARILGASCTGPRITVTAARDGRVYPNGVTLCT